MPCYVILSENPRKVCLPVSFDIHVFHYRMFTIILQIVIEPFLSNSKKEIPTSQ